MFALDIWMSYFNYAHLCHLQKFLTDAISQVEGESQGSDSSTSGVELNSIHDGSLKLGEKVVNPLHQSTTTDDSNQSKMAAIVLSPFASRDRSENINWREFKDNALPCFVDFLA